MLVVIYFCTSLKDYVGPAPKDPFHPSTRALFEIIYLKEVKDPNLARHSAFLAGCYACWRVWMTSAATYMRRIYADTFFKIATELRSSGRCAFSPRRREFCFSL